MAPDETPTRPDHGRGEASETWASRSCARCGRPFLCGAETSSCWCDLVALTDEQRAALAELKLTGCLCRECLEGL